jgi:UDP-N-acetyl-2-amino-2-deoxyglucuronate dehydrogenase
MAELPIKNRKIRWAIVGCGRISKNHFGTLKKFSSDVELVAVCDTDPKALAAAQDTYKVPGFADLNALIKAHANPATAFDVASLCTPSGIHPEQGIALAAAGRHCVTEKPMGCRWDDALKMVKAFDASKSKLFVVKQNRFNATVQKLREAIDQQRFGKIYLGVCNVFWTRPQDYYDQAKWRGTWALDGGAYMNQASHYVDLMRWFLGPVKNVQATTATFARNIEAEDSGVAQIQFQSGALGTINVTMLTYPKNLEGSITLLGEKGTVRIGGSALNKIEVWDFSDKRAGDETVTQLNYSTDSVYGFGHEPYYKNVIATLRGEANALVDGREGLTSLELLCGIYEAAKSGKRVELPYPRTGL